jgi:hypothetical protein
MMERSATSSLTIQSNQIKLYLQQNQARTNNKTNQTKTKRYFEHCTYVCILCNNQTKTYFIFIISAFG